MTKDGPREEQETTFPIQNGSTKENVYQNHQRRAVGVMPYYAALFILFGSVLALSLYRFWWVPEALSVHAPQQRFSEGRALQHVEAITGFGVRVAGQPEVDLAADYLVHQGEILIASAKMSRPDLLVQVERETVSGAVETSFLNLNYINLYNNLTNVIIAVSPMIGLQEKAVLVNAHFDSSLSTPGASDDVSNVGVILEMVRTIIANPKIQLAAPIVFLMNGGEEALCPAAHGFMQQSKWAQDIGVFINLESTGPDGPDFVFQHTGLWPMQAFAAVSPFPRGAVIAQDFFELGLVPADTDYRMFSAKLQGTLPGLDTAFLLGAGLYHTDRDTLENIRPGTIQAMGQNAIAVVEELGKQLALRTHQGVVETDTEKAIFFDVLGMFMVVYPFSWAKIIHPVLLVVTLSLPMLQKSSLGGGSLFAIYRRIAVETLVALLSLVSGILSSTFVGIFRVTALGNPMAWYGNDVMPYAILVPAALGGLLLPYLGRTINPKFAALGYTTALAGLAAAMTAAGLGASLVPTIWAMAGLITLTDLDADAGKLLQRATISCVWPIIVMMPNSIGLSCYVLQKMSFTGAHAQPNFTVIVADAVAGIVVGFVTISVVGFFTPWIAFASGKTLRRTVLVLFCISALFAAQASLGSSPYTEMAPKKVVIQHLHQHEPSGKLIRSTFAIGSVDSVPVGSLLRDKDPRLWEAQKSGWEWLTLYPLGDNLVEGTVLQAPALDPSIQVPAIQLLNRSRSGAGDRVHLQLRVSKPGLLGCMHLNGQILDWSFPRSQIPQQDEGQAHDRYVRFVGSGPDENWRFWVEVAHGSQLSVRLAAADPRGSAAVTEFTEGWPAWTFIVNMETFASSWAF